MSVGLFIDADHKLSEMEIYYRVEIGDEPGKTGKFESGLYPIPHGTKLSLSYDPTGHDQVVGSLESFLNPMEGGKFEFRKMDRDVIAVNDIECKNLFAWVYIVGGQWLKPEEVVVTEAQY